MCVISIVFLSVDTFVLCTGMLGLQSNETCPVRGEGYVVAWADYYDAAKTLPKGLWSSMAKRVKSSYGRSFKDSECVRTKQKIVLGLITVSG